MSGSGSGSSPASCPVDHSSPSGQVWNGLASKPDPKPDPLLPSSSSSPPGPAPPSHANSTRLAYLSTQRETSSIPRTANEKWVYPSEAQFYTAMLRKHAVQGSSSDGVSHVEASTASTAHSPPSTSSSEIAPECPVPHAHPRAGLKKPNPFDMQVVVPIHNAVNERTWVEILKWEDHALRSRNVKDPAICPGGLRLVSFKGDASKLTPRARWRSLLGYQAPFDRHDWVIERCGQRIHYVIDYYTGRTNGGGPFAFYIDARPALDSWEGIRMRATRFLGSLWRNTTTSSGGAVPPTQSVPGTTSARD